MEGGGNGNALFLVRASLQHSPLHGYTEKIAEGRMFSVCLDPSLCYELHFLMLEKLKILTFVVCIVQCCSDGFDVVSCPVLIILKFIPQEPTPGTDLSCVFTRE